jgi:hypothetical protein
MALETATHINDLVITNPDGLDDVSQGDNHIRMLKDVLKRDIPLTQPATATGIALLTATDSTAARSVLGLSDAAFRNRVYNGDFTVDQRNNFLSHTITAGAALAYTCDRFFAYCTGANVTGIVSQSDPNDEFSYLFTGASGNTGIGFGTRLPQLITKDLNASAALTLSVKLLASTTKTVNWAVYTANTVNSFGSIASPTKTLVASGTFSATTTKTQFSANFTISSGFEGVEILFTCGILGNAETLNIYNVQLEKGTIASSNILFEKLDPFTQQARCQQFYLRVPCTARTYASVASQSISAPIFYPRMQNTPTAALISSTGSTSNISSESIVGITRTGARMDVTSTATGDAYAIDRVYAFSAEL